MMGPPTIEAPRLQVAVPRIRLGGLPDTEPCRWHLNLPSIAGVLPLGLRRHMASRPLHFTDMPRAEAGPRASPYLSNHGMGVLPPLGCVLSRATSDSRCKFLTLGLAITVTALTACGELTQVTTQLAFTRQPSDAVAGQERPLSAWLPVGSGGGIRTPDTRIMIPLHSPKSRNVSRGEAFHACITPRVRENVRDS